MSRGNGASLAVLPLLEPSRLRMRRGAHDALRPPRHGRSVDPHWEEAVIRGVGQVPSLYFHLRHRAFASSSASKARQATFLAKAHISPGERRAASAAHSRAAGLRHPSSSSSFPTRPAATPPAPSVAGCARIAAASWPPLPCGARQVYELEYELVARARYAPPARFVAAMRADAPEFVPQEVASKGAEKASPVVPPLIDAVQLRSPRASLPTLRRLAQGLSARPGVASSGPGPPACDMRSDVSGLHDQPDGDPCTHGDDIDMIDMFSFGGSTSVPSPCKGHHPRFINLLPIANVAGQ